MSDTILAIDLGTTDSCAALYRNGTVDVAPDANGNKINASMVCYKIDSDEFLYGKFAKNESVQYAESTMLDSKRFLATKFKSRKVQNDISYLPVKIIEDTKTGKPKYVIKQKNGIKEYFPEEVSSMILEYIINYCKFLIVIQN